MRNYTMARWVWGLAYFVGVIATLLGFLVTGGSACIFGGTSDAKTKAEALFILPIAGGVLGGGLLIAALSQILLAVIDTASNTQEMLRLMQLNQQQGKANSSP